jgi:hypothetical protein
MVVALPVPWPSALTNPTDQKNSAATLLKNLTWVINMDQMQLRFVMISKHEVGPIHTKRLGRQKFRLPTNRPAGLIKKDHIKNKCKKRRSLAFLVKGPERTVAGRFERMSDWLIFTVQRTPQLQCHGSSVG